MRYKLNSIGIIAILLTLVICASFQNVEAARVYGTLSNFDIHNFTNQPVNDFELILRGPDLTCDDISDYYNGWGTVGGVPAGGCVNLPGNRIKIVWEDFNNPIMPCNYVHFGVGFNSGNLDVNYIIF